MTEQGIFAAIDKIAGEDTPDVILGVIGLIVILTLYLNAPGVIYGWP